jgi:hypothetical protein
MSLRDDPRYFPQPDVPNDGDYGSSFGREQLYYGYSPRNTAIDTANAAVGEKTATNGKYTFDPTTGQYTWVPAGAVAPSAGAGAGINAGGYEGGGGSGMGGGMGGGFPGSTMVDGVSGPTTGMASAMNAAAAGIGNFGNKLGGIYGAGLRGLSDVMAMNVDPNFSHEGRQNDTDKSGMTNLGSFNIGPTGLTAIDAPTAEQSQARADAVSGVGAAAPAGGGDAASDAASDAPSPGERGGEQLAVGGLTAFASGGLGSLGSYSDGGRLLRGPGDGVSDSIPATIGKAKRPARLADGEFVIPARIVSELGNGSTAAGARKLYAMLARIQAGRKKSVGRGKVAVNSRMDKHLPA